MLKKLFFLSAASFAALAVLFSCSEKPSQADLQQNSDSLSVENKKSLAAEGLETYVPVKLTTDVASLSENDKKLIPVLIEIAQIMDELFWEQSVGKKEEFLASVSEPDEKEFALINYGPWDRLNNNRPFIASFGEKPQGANFYPKDMTAEEFEKWDNKDKKSLYTVVVRDENNALKAVPYSQHYAEKINKAAELLQKAAEISDNESFRNYLKALAKALQSDNYRESDLLWMSLKNNSLDFICGPIETYEDKLFGYKAAFEAYVLVKDKEWSAKLDRFGKLLPKLQANLPVDAQYKKEKPGSDGQLIAYDAVFYAGDCNSGSKTIAVNLPNDEQIQLEKGTRRSQLKNVMKAKFDNIMLPIASALIAPEQRKHIKFDAFFANTMFHEVAHGLGIKSTINGKGMVREALKNYASSIEEGKADILGLFMVEQLRKMGELSEGEITDNYVTFLAGIFRSVRFGASSAHGKANMVCFNYFKEAGAFTKGEDGFYRVNNEKMSAAIAGLSKLILTLQGNGDFEGARKLTDETGVIPEDLQNDLSKLKSANIPVDIVFLQGTKVLGLGE
jgi:hypothetical protein